ncbi:putative acetyltransferase [Atopomonas hussainii]|uniref:Putative acetyltransferase n=1 Tax=Atopomonas hussainii TaxID=1429083 RepID=A0A1H7GJG0_9GAMM|nr:GNAT family N-acetyltransferase [Atopomonas hussainii]SEK38296.1 putative acetyltransferase [Atopomonas hussainii]
MHIALESPDQPEVVALIAALDVYQDSLYPPEARYALDLTALMQPQVLFAVARDAAGVAQGCAALVLSAAFGEVKRMYVQPAARGLGAAHKLLGLLENSAQARGCTQLYLETGPYQPEALAFYAKQGYQRCAAFGDYREHPLSVFMAKTLG